MGEWHREHPELIGTEHDPWSIHPDYMQSMREVERECLGCGRWRKNLNPAGYCQSCTDGAA